MLKKTLMIAAAAAAITTGATALTSSPAEAGKLNIHVGFYGKHYYRPHCFIDYRKKRIKVYEKYGYGWYWKTVWVPVKICY